MRPGTTARGGEYSNGFCPDERVSAGLTQSARKTGTVIGAAYTGLGPARALDHETHLPAKEAQARASSRLPQKDAHARGSAHAKAPAGQGSQATDGVMSHRPRSGPRPGRGRLTRSADFDRVVRRGRSLACRELVLYLFPREDPGPPRLGLSVSRKVGGAVQRNRVKRLLREAFAIESSRLSGTDAVVVARHEARSLAEREGLAGMQGALAELISRAVDGEGPSEAAPPASSVNHEAA